MNDIYESGPFGYGPFRASAFRNIIHFFNANFLVDLPKAQLLLQIHQIWGLVVSFKSQLFNWTPTDRAVFNAANNVAAKRSITYIFCRNCKFTCKLICHKNNGRLDSFLSNFLEYRIHLIILADNSKSQKVPTVSLL